MADEMYLCTKTCRLCLRSDKFQMSLFGEVAQEMQICLKIRTCLPVQVSQEDDFPKTICYKCVSALDQTYNLWRTSSESEAILKSLIYKEKQDLSAANMQQQSFCNKVNSPSVAYSKSTKASSRRLLLPTGMALIVESDSEEEYDQATQMPAVTPTANDQISTEWFWESETVHMDTSPDFLESLSQPSLDVGQTMNPSPHIAKPDQSQTVTTNYSPHIIESDRYQIVTTNYSPHITKPDQSQTVTTNYSPHIARPDQSQTVTTNCSPHIIESDQCQFVATNYSPHIAQPDHNIRITAPVETKAQGVQQSPPGNSWRSVSLFGMSANTWRNFYKSGEMFRHCQLRDNRDRTPQNDTGGTAPSGAAVMTSQLSQKGNYEDVLQAMNKRNYRAISQHSDTPMTLVNFLHAQKPQQAPQ
ncbi:uncharacterized protein LOC111866106 [Cryptotermes secundus]|uniref:uncharacterized protein LOC111866106 n=1 Tax=Cryptotermes secundus TaxID=105785 RepID=UPI000CD7C455|nr:uncharacterized protein LOC111866106 [Cryptotermes secundus]